MKKIAIFSNDLSVGGIQKSLLNLLNSIDFTKYQIDLYLLKNNNFYQEQIPSSVKVYYLNSTTKFPMLIPFNLLKFFYPYKGQEKEYDIAIDYDSYQPLTALNVLKSHAKNKIMWIHSDWEKRYQNDKKFRLLFFFTKKKNKQFDEYVGVSEPIVQSFKKINNLKQIDYAIIPNIINTQEIFKKAQEKCDLKVKEDVYNLCSVGSMVYAKGFDLLIDYIKELIEIRKDFHLYLIGDGPEKENLKSKVKDYHLEKHITFLGYQQNPYKYMNLMDGFILTSRYEGQGMVLWEAKALGLEIFITKNLEQYNKELKGHEDIVKSLKNMKKREKTTDNLEDYNNKIIKQLNKLFTAKNE